MHALLSDYAAAAATAEVVLEGMAGWTTATLLST